MRKNFSTEYLPESTKSELCKLKLNISTPLYKVVDMLIARRNFEVVNGQIITKEMI